jgi:hypothetical protein
MGSSKTNNSWGGRLWMLGLIATVLSLVILLVLWSRPLAWTTEPPLYAPTSRPGLYQIPTVAPAEPTPTPEGLLLDGFLLS